MERSKLTTLVNRFNRIVSAGAVNEIGREVRFCKRERLLTPYRLAMSLLVSFSSMKVQSLADIQRSFNALFGSTVAYKPFHNQLAKRQFADFMRTLVSTLLEGLVVRVLSFGPQGPFSEFSRIVIQDGSSFAIKDVLKTVFPGRFTKVRPAAVELHVTLDLLKEAVSRVTLTPDTFGERAYLPRGADLKGVLLLADRGYFSTPYLAEVISSGASFVIRALSDLNPHIVAACTASGKPLRGMKDRRLKEVKRLPKRETADLDVSWSIKGGTVQCRLLVTWNPKTREYQYLVTNLPRVRYAAEKVGLAYRLRWQIELLFKEWKSYANLHAFDTANAGIAEGTIWAAIAAATLKRYLAHTTQRIAGVEVSTRKVAMCAHHVLPAIFQALIHRGSDALLAAFELAVQYLSANAQRAHPKRDRRTGRSRLGLEPILGCA
jgi:hypothetical protein